MEQFMRFLGGNMFMIDMLLAAFLISFRLPRRKLFLLRIVLAFAVCLLAGYYMPRLLRLMIDAPAWEIVRDGLNYVLQFACIVAALIVCFDLSVWKGLFVGAAAYFIQHLAYDADSLIGLRAGAMIDRSLIFLRHYLVLLCATVVIYCIFLRKMRKDSLDKVDAKRVGLIACIILFVCIVINLLAIGYGENSFSFFLADLACSVVGLCYHYSVLNLSVVESEKEKIQKILQNSADQYNFYKENVDLINIKCHDLRHQLQAFHRDEKIDQSLLGEIQRVVDNYDCFVHTGNGALDVILTEKSLLCSSKKIRFTCVADGTGLSYMNPYDLYALFGNAIENAIEAVEQISDPEKRVIGLTMRVNGGFYSINLQNFVNYTVEIGKDGLPVTHKKDKQNHGFGVRSMNMLAEKYGGRSRIKRGTAYLI